MLFNELKVVLSRFISFSFSYVVCLGIKVVLMSISALNVIESADSKLIRLNRADKLNLTVRCALLFHSSEVGAVFKVGNYEGFFKLVSVDKAH